MNTRRNFKRNDNIYQPVELVNITKETGVQTRAGIDNFIKVDGQVVHVASANYGFVSNEQFYGKFENALDEAGIKYSSRAQNKSNRAFAVDYILEDDRFHINVKQGNVIDGVKPMIRAINSYDGTQKTIGQFGTFREICSNGLYVTDLKVGFKISHRGNVVDVVMPKIEELIAMFMDNEFYSLHKKFEVLAEKPVPDINEFVKYVLGKSGLAKYEKSEKNPDEPSKTAQIIIDTMQREASELGTTPNLWLGYNAFNEYIHTANEKLFTVKQDADKLMFNTILEMAN